MRRTRFSIVSSSSSKDVAVATWLTAWLLEAALKRFERAIEFNDSLRSPSAVRPTVHKRRRWYLKFYLKFPLELVVVSCICNLRCASVGHRIPLKKQQQRERTGRDGSGRGAQHTPTAPAMYPTLNEDQSHEFKSSQSPKSKGNFSL